MAIKIDISGTTISGKSQILNDVNISGNSSVNIEIGSSKMEENSKVLNGLDVENGQVNVELKDLSLGEGVEFMNDKKFTQRTSHKQTLNKSKQTTYEQDTTEKTTKTSDKKDGLLKRVLKSILKSENMEDNSEEVTYSQKTHKDFKDEISMAGKLKKLDTSEALHSAENPKREQRSTGKTR